MRALVYEGPREVHVREVPDVETWGDDESLVKMAYAGICGSDTHGYVGHDERRPPPLILGHEGSGIVVGGADEGKRVIFNPLWTCGECRDCREGREHVCGERKIMSIPPRDGCFAEYVKVPSRALLEVPPSVGLREAALTEPLACCWHGVKLAKRLSPRPIEGERCVVLGGGTIGLGMALSLRAFGVEEVWIGEPNRLRHEVLERAGDFRVFSPEDGGPEPRSAGVVIDAYGGDSSRRSSCRYVGRGGVIVHIGLAGGDGGLDVKELTLQEVVFVGCYTYTEEEFRETFDALCGGRLGDLDWIDERDFASGGQGFEDVVEGRSKMPKVMLKVG